MAGIEGLDVRELERLQLNRDPRTAFAARPSVANPIPVGTATELRPGMPGYREALGAARAPAAAAAGEAAAAGGNIARGVRALANPATPIGMAAMAGTLAPIMAKQGRDRGAGRAMDNPNAGNVEAGDLAPGQLGEIRSDALEQARGERMRAMYSDPALAAQGVGAFNAGTQERANQIALANTPLPPTGAGAGRGMVNPENVNPAAPTPPAVAPRAGADYSNEGRNAGAASADPNSGIIFKNGNEYSGKNITGDVQTIREGGVDRAARGGFVSAGAAPAGAAGVRSVADIEAAASAIEAKNSALRRQMDAYGPGVHNADGSGGVASIGSQRQADIEKARRAVEDATWMSGSSLSRNAREGQAALPAAENQLQSLMAADANDAKLRNDAGIAALTAETQRRGQDLGLAEGAQRNQGALAVEGVRNQGNIAVEGLRGKSAKEVAALSGDARVAAAEARGIKPIVVDMGEDVIETPAGPQKVKRPSLVVDSNTGKVLDLGQPAAAAQKPAGGIAADPRAVAIRDDPNLSVAEKKARLQALGY